MGTAGVHQVNIAPQDAKYAIPSPYPASSKSSRAVKFEAKMNEIYKFFLGNFLARKFFSRNGKMGIGDW